MYKNTFYSVYNRNVYSQNGEDGILEELLDRLDIQRGWVCEFGAWDGKYLSNTFNLIQNHGFSGVFIEGDPEKYKDLLKTCAEYPSIVPVCAYVDDNRDSEHTLDKILAKTEIPIDFDVLSIDIDTFDYHIWNTVEVYKPKLVIIEINSGVDPLNIKHVHTPEVYQGSGFLPTYMLGVRKGYTFVLHTGNMIFVRNDLFPKLKFSSSHLLENFRPNWLPR